MIEVKIEMPSGYWADGTIASRQQLNEGPLVLVHLPAVAEDHATPVHRSRIRIVQKEETK